MRTEERIRDLGLTLPSTPVPTASYVNSRIAGDLLYLSGQTPITPDGRLKTGKLGADLTVQQGYEHARLSCINMLAMIRDALGDLDRVEMVVKLLGMVNAVPDFVHTPDVINGCSDLLVEVFGRDRGCHARSAVGVATLPGGASVEIEAIFKISPR